MVCALPVFITGALAPQLGETLAIGAARLGVVVALYWAMMATTAVHLGRLVDQLGATVSLRIAVAGTATASWGIAATANNWWSLAAWLALAGSANALMQPAANRLLVGRVQPERLGTAMAIKQSATPLATMLAGFSLPLVALTLGWRWAFVMAGVLALVVVLFIQSTSVRTRAPRPAHSHGVRLSQREQLVLMAVAFGLSICTSTVVLAFSVDATTSSGGSPQLAGTLFAAASVVAILTRLCAGVLCDRTNVNPLRLCAALLTLGTAGLLLLATGRPLPMALGLLVALAGTWGMPGVFWLAVMRLYPDSPGRASGAIAPASLGGTLGPVLFGLMVEGWGYRAAWTTASAVAMVSALTMLVAARHSSRRPLAGTT